jgi:protein SCO1
MTRRDAGVTPVPRKTVWAALLALTLGGLLLTACQPSRVKLHGVPADPVQPAPALPLTDQFGQPFSLSTQKGKVVVVYFGYTSCPDNCPITLAQLTQVWMQLDQQQAPLFQPIFVTVDPARDTEEVIARYLSAFSRPLGDDQGLGFIGLRGLPGELDPVMAAYGVQAEKQPQPASGDGYTVGHTASIFIIDAQGNLIETFPYGAVLDDILWDVRYLIQKGTKG